MTKLTEKHGKPYVVDELRRLARLIEDDEMTVEYMTHDTTQGVRYDKMRVPEAAEAMKRGASQGVDTIRLVLILSTPMAQEEQCHT